MLGKVKQYLGIEGIKLNLEIPEIIDKKATMLEGNIVLTTKNRQTAKSFKIRLVERYSRGRSSSRLINEYVAGDLEFNQLVIVEENETVKVPFKLPYHIAQSRMDLYEDQNFLFRGAIKLLKMANAVKSEFRVEVEAKVSGTALDPSYSTKVTVR